eukprot:64195-Amphidinium_carterae.1
MRGAPIAHHAEEFYSHKHPKDARNQHASWHKPCRYSSSMHKQASSLRDDLADMGMAGIPQLHQALLAGTLRMERCIA